MADTTRTRLDLQRVATHVLARRRHDVTGRFGLRATPGGFGTPAFAVADVVEVVRVAGSVLVHEVGQDVRTIPIHGSSLGGLAAAVGVDLSNPFTVGHDTPELGDVDVDLEVDLEAARHLADWLDLGWQALDRVTGDVGGAMTVQLWPEHLDAGTSVPVGPGPDARANIGASLGDSSHPEPYLYVGPWGPERPGDPAFWNAPFGAVLGAADWPSLNGAVAFLRRGLDLLRA